MLGLSETTFLELATQFVYPIDKFHGATMIIKGAKMENGENYSGASGPLSSDFRASPVKSGPKWPFWV